jgi:hypothetical protein
MGRGAQLYANGIALFQRDGGWRVVRLHPLRVRGRPTAPVLEVAAGPGWERTRRVHRHQFFRPAFSGVWYGGGPVVGDRCSHIGGARAAIYTPVTVRSGSLPGGVFNTISSQRYTATITHVLSRLMADLHSLSLIVPGRKKQGSGRGLTLCVRGAGQPYVRLRERARQQAVPRSR